MLRSGWKGLIAAIVLGCAPGTGSAPTFESGGLSNQGGGSSTGGLTAVGGAGGTGSGTGTAGTGATPGSGGLTASGGVTGTGSGAGTGGTPVFDAGTDPNRNAVQAGHVCDRLATIQCAGEAYCCANPGRTYTECYQTQFTACQNTAYLDAITLNAVSGYDTTKAQAAFTTFEQLASNCDPTVAQWAISQTGLRGIVTGTKAPGSDCTSSNLLDKPTDAAFLASCTNGDTTTCLPTITTWTCAARAQAGGTCFTDLNCVDGVYCDNPSLGFNGVCRTRKADGATCTAGNECTSLFCKSGLCVAATQQVAYCLK